MPRSAQYPDGYRKQVWRYPSRADCMVCHSRAANYVLGLNTLQLNREHDYGKVRDNQLRVLEHLGLLRVDWRETAKTALRDACKTGNIEERRGVIQGLIDDGVLAHTGAARSPVVRAVEDTAKVPDESSTAPDGVEESA